MREREREREQYKPTARCRDNTSHENFKVKKSSTKNVRVKYLVLVNLFSKIIQNVIEL